MKFQGIMTALVTPMDQNGKVQEKQFRALIQDQLKNRIDSLLVLGGTGEYGALTTDQRKMAIDITMDEVAGQVPVIVGVVSPGLGDCIELGKYAKQAGAEAVMLVTPYYLNPTDEGFLKYYQAFDRNVDIPIILYNIPYKTGITISNALVEQVVEAVPNVVGIKVCTVNMGDILDLLHTVGDKIAVLCGEDDRAVSSLIAGVPGAITASSNLIPDVWKEIHELVLAEQYKEAVTLHQKYYPLMKALYKEENPGPLKAALDLVGLQVGAVSAPLMDASEEVVKELEEKIGELGLVR